jgi:hypothetical protein
MLSVAAVPAISRERMIRLVRIGLSLEDLDLPSIGMSLTGTVSPMDPAGNDPSVPTCSPGPVRSGHARVK